MPTIKHAGKEYEIPAGSTAEEAFEALKAVTPELANATLQKDGENYTTEVKFGKKG